MSNILYKDDLFNEEIKEEYLKAYSGETKRTLSRLFKASSKTEELLKKDLYDFKLEEIKKLMFYLAPTKLNSSRHIGHTLAHYIDWAIERGLRKTLNPLRHLENEWYEQFVDFSEYFTEEQLIKILSRCENAQDRVIIRLLMEGVGGEGHAELLNLTINDIDNKRNILRLRSENGLRELTVSKDCIEECYRAYRESEYQKSNGMAFGAKVLHTKLTESDYIIRVSRTNTADLERADKHVIYRRLSVLSKVLNEPHLNAKQITYSGMLILARDLYLSRGKLEKDEYNVICETFGVTTKISNEEYNYYRLKREFLNLEKLKELYEI